MKLLHRSRRDSADDEVEELDRIKFRELLALNIPDWYLVLLGVVCAAILGALFPLMAIIFSGILEVSMCSSVQRKSFFLVLFWFDEYGNIPYKNINKYIYTLLTEVGMLGDAS